jgi:exopolysaccharide biosynthesis polyprenyl glycosylphosphotransferase
MSDSRTARASYAKPVLDVRRWQKDYAVRLQITDVALVLVTVVVAYLARYQVSVPVLKVPTVDAGLSLDYRVVCLVLIVTWLVSLRATGTMDRRVLGSGSTEYSRVSAATGTVFGLLAIIALFLKLSPSRGFILMTFVGGMVLLPVGRWVCRKWLIHQRKKGACTHHVVLLGSRDSCLHAASSIARDGGASGFVVVGAIVDDPDPDELLPGIPVLRPQKTVSSTDPVNLAEAAGADGIVYTGSDNYDPRSLRELGWQIEARHMTLTVSPGLTDIAGPRISTHAVAGLPLVQVDYPTLEGPRRFIKRAMDVVGSAVLLVVLSPVFLVIAIAVKVTSPGPVIFHQDRVGLGCKRFKMLKFRSMVANAEEILPTLLGESEGNPLLFKMKDDPRVTRVGRFLRRYSLDELPQLVNVLRNDMSLVGPRPPLRREVEKYDDWAHRRLLVKPGMTGLWQTSGRSDLSWEDSLRLDLYYVENWSVVGDIVILWRTIRAVLRSDGAY